MFADLLHQNDCYRGQRCGAGDQKGAQLDPQERGSEMRSKEYRPRMSRSGSACTLSLGIVEEELDTVGVVGSVEGVSSDSDNCRLPQSSQGGLVDSFVGESARARNNADLPRRVDVSWHDPHLAFPGLLRIKGLERFWV